MLVIPIVVFSQSTCPKPVTSFTFSFWKPVVDGQKIGHLNVCDEDKYQTFIWSLSTGNSAGNWRILNGDIFVNKAINVNKGTNTSYYLTAKVTDNGTNPPNQFSTAKVTLKVISAPVNCPDTSRLSFPLARPVVLNQIVGQAYICAEDLPKVTQWAFTGGNSSGNWRVDNIGNLIVNKLSINTSTTKTYTVTIVAKNSTGVILSTSIIKVLMQ